MALIKERQTRMRLPERESHPVAAGVKILAGSLVVLEAGFARPGRTATGLISRVRAERIVCNRAQGGLSIVSRPARRQPVCLSAASRRRPALRRGVAKSRKARSLSGTILWPE